MITSDEQWLQNWRKQNPQSLMHTTVYSDTAEKKAKKEWDSLRTHLRERYGDTALAKVRFVPINREDDE